MLIVVVGFEHITGMLHLLREVAPLGSLCWPAANGQYLEMCYTTASSGSFSENWNNSQHLCS